MAQRLKYRDENGNNQVIGYLNEDPGSDSAFLRARLVFRAQNPNKLTVWSEKDTFGSLPIKAGDFDSTLQNGDPAIFWQENQFTTAVTGVDTSADSFTVSGDRTGQFEEGGSVDISGSTGNDGIYTVLSSSDVTYDSTNDETTITVDEDVTDSTADGDLTGYENIFRGYPENQGVITENGAHKFHLWGFEKYTGRQKASHTTATTTNVKDAMQDILPSTYTIDAPSSSNVSYVDSSGTEQTGFMPIDDYTLTGKREAGYRELTKIPSYAVKFKADKTVRYEPLGQGGTVDTIDGVDDYDGTNTLGRWKEWTKDRTKHIITEVQAVGFKSNGEKVTSAVKTSSLESDFGSKFQRFQVGYNVNGQTEIDRIAEQLLMTINTQNAREGGVVKATPRYTLNEVSNSFQLKDAVRSIDASFTLLKQVNYYPENASVLTFEFEKESEGRATESENLRQEREKLLGSSTGVEVGNHGSGSINTEDVNDEYDTHQDAAVQHDVEGQSYTEVIDGTNEADSFTPGNGISVDSSLSTSVTGPGISGQEDYFLIAVTGTVTNSTSSTDGWNLSIDNTSTSTNLVSVTNWIPGDIFPNPGTVSSVFVVDRGTSDLEGDNVEATITNKSDSSEDAGINLTVVAIGEMTINQPSATDGTSQDSDGSTNTTNSSDSNAGDTTSLDTEGSTGSDTVDIVKSPSKEDR